ncbi:hypothetical protein AKJ08_1883 [Vulgatibacter incomptus]|uniref:DUF3332 domain-containing protein n=1 Tax=Vulgatibacter incomptus TaxID=1391653 RepID=A0A0K1PDL1_9BACT|nr:hypothetical protein AKJ08_1883 [Vulgatibacter incomptus]
MGGKWVQELVFLGLSFIPVYGLFLLGDAFIFNTIEFWTGHNPIAGNVPEIGEERIVELPDGSPLKLVRESEDGIRVEHEGVVRHFVRTADGFEAWDDEGNLLAAVHGQVNGDVVVTDATGSFRSYTAEELALAGNSTVSVAAWASEQARQNAASMAAR